MRQRGRLQRLMNNGLRKSNGAIALDNNSFRSFAFNTHVPAYQNSGLLDLSIKDKATIGLTPDFADLATGDGVKQASIIYVNQLFRWITDLSKPIFNNKGRNRSWGDYDTKN